MKTQSSFQTQTTTGTLYIVPTPIGNLEDITIRAMNTLKEVELIAAEDTRNTKKLLNHFTIDTPLISYHEHNKQMRESKLMDLLYEGKDIALVSDAGMPGISDPGFDIIKAAIDGDITVVVLPGANAALCALVGSGLPTTEFYFYGFLPRKKKEKIEALDKLRPMQATILFYESPHRLVETLQALYEQFGDRSISVARELSKRFEEYIRGSLEEVLAWANETNLKGEFCLVVEGNNADPTEQEQWWDNISIKQHVEHYMEVEQLRSKDAIKKVAEERKQQKRYIYQAYHVE
ncbi:16S rRNA (cytidine(1402)-2'-O)-methyltransferase [Aquibacillus koreensis]|uniref:Ribosomal RNA small subunit methyltransferase I n=1 Tax=Aquibacillus koreensis TaxID=279446 RepID=A0A9X3WQG5_9BACI|nr:16S rRNA (cytidine(1402)-2'-O)-methyltransferase [Aquibacillus koreensis]MCT2534329.1 16S rRNA (cytidine(1402)-2'-O)-methyltransferase [Aquibacillus koreensis]MDC3422406.1 16S rRNA (cytidine(1402)-2'-O)-methyltransferase [Aquibacillus koreensis]